MVYKWLKSDIGSHSTSYLKFAKSVEDTLHNILSYYFAFSYAFKVSFVETTSWNPASIYPPVTCSNVIPDYNKRQPSGILT